MRRFSFSLELFSFACATENVDELVANDLFDVCSCGLEVLTRIEMIGMLVEVLTDGAGHSKTQVGVDVDLADGQSGGLTQLLFGNTDSVGHLAAVGVDHSDVLLRNGGRAVQNDGEAGQTLGDFFQNVETQSGRNQDAFLVQGALLGSELVSAVGGADGDGQGVTTGAGHELFDFLGTGVGSSLSGDVDFVFDASQGAQLSLDNNTVIVSVLNDLLGDLDVLLEGLGRSVDHDGSEAAVDAGLAGLEAVAVVQVQSDGNFGALDNSSLNQLHQVGVVGVSAGTLGNLQDNGSLLLLASLGDSLNDFHVVDVESTNSVAAVVSLLEHLGSSNKSHFGFNPFLFSRGRSRIFTIIIITQISCISTKPFGSISRFFLNA